MMLLSAWRARSRPLRVGFVELEAWHNEEGIAVEPRLGRLVLDANLDFTIQPGSATDITQVTVQGGTIELL
jgi:hypothetical protein